MSLAALGGAVTGAVLVGGGIADAAPAPAPGPSVVPASCGQTVTAQRGDLVEVRSPLGSTRRYVVSAQPGSVQHIAPGLEQPFCDVAIEVTAPVATTPAQTATGAAPAPATVPGAAPAPGAAAPRPAAPGAPIPWATAPDAPRAAAPPAVVPERASAARAASANRSSHHASPAPASDLPFPAVLPGAAPGAVPLSAPDSFSAVGPDGGAPGAATPPVDDPAARVLPASGAAQLPASSERDGLGVPLILALIAGAGVAAGGVRVAMTRRAAKNDPAVGPVPPPEVPPAPAQERATETGPTEIYSSAASLAVAPRRGPGELDESETVTISRAMSAVGR